jgi:hypothetical protein
LGRQEDHHRHHGLSEFAGACDTFGSPPKTMKGVLSASAAALARARNASGGSPGAASQRRPEKMAIGTTPGPSPPRTTISIISGANAFNRCSRQLSESSAAGSLKTTMSGNEHALFVNQHGSCDATASHRIRKKIEFGIRMDSGIPRIGLDPIKGPALHLISRPCWTGFSVGHLFIDAVLLLRHGELR